MFDIAPTELLLVAFVALVVIGPKDLPKALRVLGYWVGKARGVARTFRSGFDSMVREAELEEMEKKWAAENERIMREHPVTADASTADPVHGDPVHGDPVTGDPVTGDPVTGDPVNSDPAVPAESGSPGGDVQHAAVGDADHQTARGTQHDSDDVGHDSTAEPVMVEKPQVLPSGHGGDNRSEGAAS